MIVYIILIYRTIGHKLNTYDAVLNKPNLEISFDRSQAFGINRYVYSP